MLDPSASWRISLFGPLVISKPNGKCIALTGTKAGELLAYLSLHPERAHSRDRLISLLWEETDVGNTRTRLRQEIHRLRGLFALDSDPPLLMFNRNELQVNPVAKIDAVRFLALCSELLQARDWEREREIVTEVCRLYRQNLLSEYDALWIAAERARFSHLYEQLLQDHAERCRLRHEYDEAEEALQCLMSHSPLLEEAHVALMHLFAEQGQPSRVRRQYQALERNLEAFGEKPSKATRALMESLRQCGSVMAAAYAEGIERVKEEKERTNPAAHSTIDLIRFERDDVEKVSQEDQAIRSPDPLIPHPVESCHSIIEYRKMRHHRFRPALLFGAVALTGIWLWYSHLPALHRLTVTVTTNAKYSTIYLDDDPHAEFDFARTDPATTLTAEPKLLSWQRNPGVRVDIVSPDEAARIRVETNDSDMVGHLDDKTVTIEDQFGRKWPIQAFQTGHRRNKKIRLIP